LTLNVFSNELDDVVTMCATLYSGLEGGSGTYDGETLMVCNWVAEEDGGYIPDLDKFVITQEYQLYFA